MYHLTPKNFSFTLLSVLFVASFALSLIIIVQPVGAESMSPNWGCPNCTRIGTRIVCNDYQKCSYPNSDGEYFIWYCCDCDGSCVTEYEFTGNCRYICE